MSQSLAAQPASPRNRTEAAVFGLLGLAVPFFLAATMTAGMAFLPARYGAAAPVAFRFDHPVTILCAVLLLLAVALSVAAARMAKQLPALRGSSAHG